MQQRRKITIRNVKLLFLTIYLAVLAGFFSAYLSYRIEGFTAVNETLSTALHNKADDFLVNTLFSLGGILFSLCALVIDVFVSNKPLERAFWIAVIASILAVAGFFTLDCMWMGVERNILDDKFLTVELPIFKMIAGYVSSGGMICLVIVLLMVVLTKRENPDRTEAVIEPASNNNL